MHALDAEVRLYDHLFSKEDPFDVEDGGDYKDNINPDSLVILNNCKLEPSLTSASIEDRYQFLRMGYFCLDKDSTNNKLVFNRTVTLKDTWSKITKKD